MSPARRTTSRDERLDQTQEPTGAESGGEPEDELLEPEPVEEDLANPPDPEAAKVEVGEGEAEEEYYDGPTWDELDAVAAERDEYLAMARAKQAEFENYRKLVMRRQAEHMEQAAADLVVKLLPVLDALDQGVAHGDDSLVTVRSQLLGVLEKEGLTRVEGGGAPFDPNEHEAVAHEPGEGGAPVVAETLRAGYRWNSRLVRAAMVTVRD